MCIDKDRFEWDSYLGRCSLKLWKLWCSWGVLLVGGCSILAALCIARGSFSLSKKPLFCPTLEVYNSTDIYPRYPNHRVKMTG